jgi:hypothetical protein
MHPEPNEEACFTSVHGFTGCGDLHRSGPIGGAANGIPLNETTPSDETPVMRPPVTSASRTSAFAAEINHAAARTVKIDTFCTETTSVSGPHHGIPLMGPFDLGFYPRRDSAYR